MAMSMTELAGPAIRRHHDSHRELGDKCVPWSRTWVAVCGVVQQRRNVIKGLKIVTHVLRAVGLRVTPRVPLAREAVRPAGCTDGISSVI